VIRKVTVADIAKLVQVVRQTEVFKEAEIAVAQEVLELASKDEHEQEYSGYVYDNGSEVLGYYVFGQRPLTVATYDMYWIVVAPEVHGKGVASTLLSHCEENIQKRKGELIIVETSSTNKYDRTRAFYKKNHYAQAARIKNFYSKGDDLVIYIKHL